MDDTGLTSLPGGLIVQSGKAFVGAGELDEGVARIMVRAMGSTS